MTTWLPATIVSLLSFGLWGFFTKLAVVHIDAKSAIIYQALGYIIVSFSVLSMMQFRPNTNLTGLSFGTLSGVAASIGCLFCFIAASRGNIITVVTVTALYPIITIILSILFLHEIITLKQTLGIIAGLIAIYLMSS